jgi:hypothetical protein
MIRCFLKLQLERKQQVMFPYRIGFRHESPHRPRFDNIRLLDFFLLFSHYSLVSFPTSSYNLHERYWYYL